MKKPHQCQRVLDHMVDHGYITPLIAFSYGITRLAARIQDLQAQGVMTDNVLLTNDVGVRYSKYTLRYPTVEQSRKRQGLSWRL